MNRRIVHSFLAYIVIGVVGILVASCSKQLVASRHPLSSYVTVKGGKNVPLITSKFFERAKNNESLADYNTSNYMSILQLLPRDFVLWKISNVNIDPNFFDEYVIVYSTREDPTVRILVSKYDVATESYYFVWQFTTTFSGDENVNMYTKDITGDFRNEIIVIGNDKDGKRAIEVFEGDDTMESYKSIFFTTGNEIEIVEIHDQSDEGIVTYPLQHQIVVTSRNDNVEITKKFFEWNIDNNTFVLTNIVRHSIDELIQEKIAKLKNATEVELKEYLRGYWIKKGENNESNEQISIIFSNNSEQIIFIDKNSARIYSWTSFFRTISNYGGTALQINIKSKILPSLFNWIRVEILLQDEIFIVVNEDFSPYFNGTFVKVRAVTASNSHLFSSFNIFTLTPASKSIVEFFSGNFINQETQNVYIVSYPRIRKIAGNIETLYYYKIFDLNNNTGIELLDLDMTSEFYFIEQVDNRTWRLDPVQIYADAYYRDFKKDSIVLKVNESIM